MVSEAEALLGLKLGLQFVISGVIGPDGSVHRACRLWDWIRAYEMRCSLLLVQCLRLYSFQSSTVFGYVDLRLNGKSLHYWHTADDSAITSRLCLCLNSKPYLVFQRLHLRLSNDPIIPLLIQRASLRPYPAQRIPRR
jgi:hypothetical protein